MGDFRQSWSADGSWAHAPDEEKQTSTAPQGPFMVTDMPARAPAPKPQSEKTRKLLKGVAGSTGGEE